jgi:hypothetical protein
MEGDKSLQFALEQKALQRVSGDPLPGALAEAFIEGPIAAGGQQIRKLVLSDWLILKTLKSSLIDFIEEIRQDPTKVPNTTLDDTQSIALCYQFTRPAKECRALLRKGVDTFNEAAVEWGDIQSFTAVHVNEMVQAVIEQVRRSWLTSLKYAASKENSSIDFNGAINQTALDGGLTTLAGSCVPSEASKV